MQLFDRIASFFDDRHTSVTAPPMNDITTINPAQGCG